jgi:uncharacterized protein
VNGTSRLWQPWPEAALDVPALRRQGWRPEPLRQFVFKIHQRCNLACDYCYVYTLADQSWRTRPVMMSEQVWTAAAERIGEHARRHSLTRVSVVLHGGEPLLAGGDRIADITRTLRSVIPAEVRFGMQTNGMLLTERFLKQMRELGVRIAVSLDGSQEDNDAHRRNAAGRGSYAQVERALQLLNEDRFREIYSGLLCTIDAGTDPVATYEALLKFQPPAIDVLFPHANWVTVNHGAKVADWLIALFERWSQSAVLETRVRLFESIIRLVLGRKSQSEFLGLAPSVVAVVESDGAIEQTDALKSAYPGAADTGLSVLTDTFDAMLLHPGSISRQIGTAALSADCLRCEVRDICGGGHYAHRYHPDTGFRNPSAYCTDLYVLINHIRSRVLDDLGA